MEFKGKVAFITGAASGIGRATALRLARSGATLYLTDIDASGLETLLGELGSQDIRAMGEILDVADSARCTASIARAVHEFGRLDVLCNIAGMLKTGHLADFSIEDWQRMVDVNLSGVFYLCRAAMPHLQQNAGCIVNMSSSAGLSGQAYTVIYAATKAGVVMMSKALAMEFASRGVRVNALCPGAIKTPMARQFQLPEGANQSLFQRMMPPSGDIGTPEQVAEAVAFLASESAAYITGVALPIDGGQTSG